MRRFEWYGPDHWGALIACAVLSILSVRIARRSPEGAATTAIRWALALLLTACLVTWHVRKIVLGRWELHDSLPFQLCDVAGAAAVLALVRPRTWSFELLWFWGLAATAQGLITPDLRQGFPGFFYLMFFTHHGCIVIAALLVGPGLGLKARAGAPWRLLAYTNLFALCAALANWLTGGNYMYLARPPAAGSLLDWLGPWPWYVLSAQPLALGLFFLLDLPFRRGRARQS